MSEVLREQGDKGLVRGDSGVVQLRNQEGSTNVLEAVAGACRSLASEPHLLILHHLAREAELHASGLARQAKLPQDQLSHYMGRLVSVGAVIRRRSGAFVYYSLAEGAAPDEHFHPWGLVSEALRDPTRSSRRWTTERLLHVSPPTVRRVGGWPARAMDMIFDAATAFGNVRRLRLLRLLAERGTSTANAVVQELQMSPPACARHLDKLVRRGYVGQQGPGAWALAEKHKTPFHSALLSLVIAATMPQRV